MGEKKIMVIDDEPAVHRLLQIILEDDGYDIVGIESHEGTRDTVSKGRPDLIILDIMMPELSGFDVLHILKTDEETRDIPVVILTASNRREDREKAARLGAESFLTKPFQPAELLRVIRSAISTSYADRCSG